MFEFEISVTKKNESRISAVYTIQVSSELFIIDAVLVDIWKTVPKIMVEHGEVLKKQVSLALWVSTKR